MSQPLVLFPTANPERASSTAAAWIDQGYDCNFWTDGRFGRYPGYFAACNQMISHWWDIGYDLFICGSDDILPDPDQPAEEMVAKYRSRFPDHDGVMQPVGDSLPGTAEICGSPWIGRRFIENTYHNRGPYHPAYQAYFGDEELMCVAQQADRLWMVLSAKQEHLHWLRPDIDKLPYQAANERFWDLDKALFAQRKKDGFPGATDPG